MGESFRLGVGGPLCRIERATHLDRPRPLVLAAIGLTWVPLAALSLLEQLLGHKDDAWVLKDLSVDARLLVTLPLLLVADRFLDRACAISVRRLFEERFVAPEQCDRVRRILRSAERWRDSSIPEAVLLAGAVGVGVATLVGPVHPAGLVHGLVELRRGPARYWYSLVSQPIGYFVLSRSLFRWGLWVRVLAGLSRVPLRLAPMHADRRGGLGFLKLPSLAYGSLLLLGLSSMQWGAWANQILEYGLKVESLKPLFFIYAVVGVAIVLGPLLLFVPMLVATRVRAYESYGGLMSDYARQLDEHWIVGHQRGHLLGSADFQSLADFGQTYRDNIEEMQVLLFDLRDGVILLVAALLPALPCFVALMGVGETLGRLADVFMGRVR